MHEEDPEGGRVVRSFSDGKLFYRLEWVRCGRKNCTRCPHGPYWYVYGRRKGKPFCRYIGKALTAMKDLKLDLEKNPGDLAKDLKGVTPDMFDAVAAARIKKGVPR